MFHNQLNLSYFIEASEFEYFPCEKHVVLEKRAPTYVVRVTHLPIQGKLYLEVSPIELTSRKCAGAPRSGVLVESAALDF